MLIRACLCLLLLAASAAAAAREVKHSSPNSGACADTATLNAEASANRKNASPAAATKVPARDAKPRPAPSVHSDAPARPAVRWHSFLPGMFR